MLSEKESRAAQRAAEEARIKQEEAARIARKKAEERATEFESLKRVRDIYLLPILESVNKYYAQGSGKLHVGGRVGGWFRSVHSPCEEVSWVSAAISWGCGSSETDSDESWWGNLIEIYCLEDGSVQVFWGSRDIGDNPDPTSPKGPQPSYVFNNHSQIKAGEDNWIRKLQDLVIEAIESKKCRWSKFVKHESGTPL